jgi:hypothetical protein
MPRRQILSSEEKERLLIVPDDDVFLTRMCFLVNMTSRSLINTAGQLTVWALQFYSAICETGFPPDKSISPHDGVVFRLAAFESPV